MITQDKFSWQDGNYDITLDMAKDGFYCIVARCRRRGEIVFAVTRKTAELCKQYVYERIHAKFTES